MTTSSWRTVLAILILASGFLFAQQVATGTPSFNSFGGGPFDTVNLGNLNVHFAIPILHKAGRGMAFTYDLNYDSSVWTPVTSAGTTSWSPVVNWGWRGVTEVELGYASYKSFQDSCTNDNTGQQYYFTHYYNYAYHDPFGVVHQYDMETGTFVPPRDCSTGLPVSATETAPDGSGYYMSVTLAAINSVQSRAGTTLHPPVNVQNGGGSKIDTNGNEITTDGNGNFYDTLSSTTPVLTVSGSGTPSSPMLYKYTAPSGSSAQYKVNYTQYTVRTNFGSAAIAEYGPLSNPLPSSIQLPDATQYQIVYEATPGSCTPLSGTYSANCITGRIASITLPTGGTVAYTYTGGTNGINSDGSTAGVTRVLSPGGGSGYQYTRTLESPTLGPGSTWQTAVVDPTGNNTVINFSEATGSTYNMYETQRQVYQGSVSSGNLLLTTTSCYNDNYVNCTAATPGSPITQTDQFTQPAAGGVRLSEVTYSNNLVTDDKEYNYGVSLNAAPASTYLVRETVTTYASLGNGIINRPASVVVKDWTNGSAVTIQSTSYTYDQGTVTATSNTPQHVSISGSRGNPTTISSNVTGTTSLSKTMTYFDTGNPNVATDVNGAQTTYAYSSTGSCGNSFATTINEPLSLSRSITWNCTGGTSTQVQDENGKNVSSTYSDPDFWRPASLTDQMSNQTNVSYSAQTAVESALQNLNGGSSASDSRTTVDGFGRATFRQRLQQPNGSNYDTVETDYNSLGQAYRLTMPYTATASPSNENTTVASTTKTFDALGRVLTITDSDNGQVSYTYTAKDVLQTVTGSQGFKKQFEYDGLGRLTSVCEISLTLPGVGTCAQGTTQTGYWTKYTYDALGHLLAVTQNAQASSGSQQNRVFTYDMLGRMVTESNPETANSNGNNGQNGTITYTYDTACTTTPASPGDLTGKVDAAGNKTCYYYDALHRLSGGGYNNVCRQFHYDTSVTPPTGITVANTKTRVVEASTNNCASTQYTDEWFSYDAKGELTDVYESTPHSGGYYHGSAGYWPTGALNTINLLNSSATALIPTQTYGLDSEGRTNSVHASSGQNPVTSVTYSTGASSAPLGALTGVTFGSADSDAFTYDPNTGRMATYTFSVNSKTDVGTLTWNTNGTLAKLVINDQIPSTTDSQTCTYGYDDLKRISNVTCGTFWVQNFTYDAFGNITKNVPQGDGGQTFLPSYWTSPPTNQFTSLPGVSVKYDSNGNLLTDNLNTYTWDPNWNTMTTVSTGSTTVTGTYDAYGRMVENNAGGSYTEFIYGPTGKIAKANGQTLTKAFVGLPGRATAIYNSTGLAYYRHSDWLGSSRLTSTATPPTSMYSSSAYAPFGEQYKTAGNADASYTGKDQDTVNDLYDFPARRLSPSQGRWITPDPAGLTAVNLMRPQTWNRYVYSENNPLAYIDEDGTSDCDEEEFACDDIGGGDGGGDDSGDDGSGGDGCTSSIGADGSTTVTCTPIGPVPCIMVVGGVADDEGEFTGVSDMGAIGVYPLGQSAMGSSPLGNGVAGVGSVAIQAFGGPNVSSYNFQSALQNLQSQSSNIILVGYSGGAQTIASGVSAPSVGDNLNNGLQGVTGVIYISPSAPGGFANTQGIPTMTFTGGGFTNTVVQDTNAINGVPSQVNPIPGCDAHNFGCEGTGPNGVLNGAQSNCPGQGGNDATGGNPNVGELVEPFKSGSGPLLTKDGERRESGVVAGGAY